MHSACDLILVSSDHKGFILVENIHCQRYSIANDSLFSQHPGYIRTSNFPNDLALLQLDEPVDTTSGEARVACLPQDEELSLLDNTKCWISGWGETRGLCSCKNSIIVIYCKVPKTTTRCSLSKSTYSSKNLQGVKEPIAIIVPLTNTVTILGLLC